MSKTQQPANSITNPYELHIILTSVKDCDFKIDMDKEHILEYFYTKTEIKIILKNGKEHTTKYVKALYPSGTDFQANMMFNYLVVQPKKLVLDKSVINYEEVETISITGVFLDVS